MAANSGKLIDMPKRHSVQRTVYSRLASHGQAVFLRGRTRETHEELAPPPSLPVL